jgi:TolB-like protein/tetratricopeptide (TPR) repeat protein
MQATESTTDSAFARDAFISYANQDTALADALCADLERRGLACWIAPRDVVPGALYADSIVRAINGAKVLVLVLSQHSVASPHVSKEIERASSKRRPIIALRIDAAPLTPALEYFLSESQWVDAAAAGGMQAAFAKLGEALRRSLQTGAAPAFAPAADAAAPHATTPIHATTPARAAAAVSPGPAARRRWMVAGAVALLVAACAYLLVARPWLAKPRAAAGAGTAASQPVDSAPATPPAPAGPKSVAVLPFEDMSEKKDQAYFSDGLASELIDLLAKVPGLRVPARTSSFYFKGKQTTLPDIAKALKVTHILEGSVRKSGDTVRITTDLVRVEDGTPMWSETFDRKLDDIFKVQDEIATSVVGALKVSLLGGAAPHAAPTTSAAAYTAFLKCAEASDAATRELIARAIQVCKQAVDLDPNYAPGWLAYAGNLQAQFAGYGTLPYQEARPPIYAAIQHALSIDPNSAAAHAAMAGFLYQMDFNPAAAEVEMRRAIALDPQDSWSLWLSGYIASIQGRFEEAVTALERSRDGNPLNRDVYIQLGNVYYRWGKLPEAASAYRATLTINPEAGSVHYRLGLTALLGGDPKAALLEFEQEPDRDFHAVGPPLALDALGRKAEADRALAAAEQTAAQGAAYQVALIHAARNDADGAFRWLERAYEQRDAGMLWIKYEPLLKPLRPDPRFQSLLVRMHLN